jgi:hypothetical protein
VGELYFILHFSMTSCRAALDGFEEKDNNIKLKTRNCRGADCIALAAVQLKRVTFYYDNDDNSRKYTRQ